MNYTANISKVSTDIYDLGLYQKHNLTGIDP